MQSSIASFRCGQEGLGSLFQTVVASDIIMRKDRRNRCEKPPIIATHVLNHIEKQVKSHFITFLMKTSKYQPLTD